MKPFLCVDLTTNKKNEQLNGTEFLVIQPSAAMTQAHEQSTKAAEETLERAKLPAPMRIIQTIFGCLGAIMAVGLLKGMRDVTITQAYQNAPWIFWIGGASLAIWGVCKLWSMHKEKVTFDAEESTQTLTHIERTRDAVYAEMAVPADAREVDILAFLYKEKGGKIKLVQKGMQLAPYFNPIFKIFADSENLYLADLEGKYAFPLSSITAIHTVKKHIRMGGWNKATSFDNGRYKQYKLTRDQYGCIHSKRYHIVEVNRNGQAYGIYIPCYELPVFEKLTKLKAQD